MPHIKGNLKIGYPWWRRGVYLSLFETVDLIAVLLVCEDVAAEHSPTPLQLPLIENDNTTASLCRDDGAVGADTEQYGLHCSGGGAGVRPTTNSSVSQQVIHIPPVPLKRIPTL